MIIDKFVLKRVVKERKPENAWEITQALEFIWDVFLWSAKTPWKKKEDRQIHKKRSEVLNLSFEFIGMAKSGLKTKKQAFHLQLRYYIFFSPNLSYVMALRHG